MLEVGRSLRAMNTGVEVVIVTPESMQAEAIEALDDVEALFYRVETVLSRFAPESELSQLNAAAGRPFRVSPLLLQVVRAALDAARATSGMFDPTVLNALLAAGYDRSYELLAESAGRPAAPVTATADYSWRHVRLDMDAGLIMLPSGCGLDLGGIAKGWTADQAAQHLLDFKNFVVNAGGDLYAAGRQVDGTPWTVGVEDPTRPGHHLMVLSIRDRAIATCTTMRRRWRRAGQEQHHLIDPRTRRPSQSGVVSATVIAGSVARAEVLAKVALLLGQEAGMRFLGEQEDADGLLVLASGQWDRSAGPMGVAHDILVS